MISDNEKICQLGHSVITKEAQALLNLAERLDDKFAQACRILLTCHGRIVVIGMGKSGHIANKVAATLASTGSPAFFLHPAEASHGDLGNIVKNDVILAISGSGNTPEIIAILPTIKELNVPLIAITGNPNSTLAKIADINLNASVEHEACTLGLAPTSSTTAALAMGDALAITLLNLRNFTAEDFARTHPGGIIGKKLCLHVKNIMRTGENIPHVTANTVIATALVEMSLKQLGMTLVVDDINKNKLLGIYTDGDLRRTLDKKIDINTTRIQDVMTKKFKTVTPDTLAIAALQTMEQFQITSLVVVDNGMPIGAIHIHDLLKEGVG